MANLAFARPRAKTLRYIVPDRVCPRTTFTWMLWKLFHLEWPGLTDSAAQVRSALRCRRVHAPEMLTSVKYISLQPCPI